MPPRPEPTDVRFVVPQPPAGYVERPRLTRRLEEAAARSLTLISAPAGTGKTALAAAWSANHTVPGRVSWITFEADDQHAAAFWSSVVACLSRAGIAMPDGPRDAHATHRRMLTELSAAVTKAPGPVTLVLDGLELVDPVLGEDIAWVLRHTGHRLRLVVLTRVDPLLPLHQLRLDGAVAELRVADLAFTSSEAAQLVERSGATLRPDSIETLVSRTQGWAVGLRFAAMRLADDEDPDRAVRELIGDSGNIAEYLMSEMLETLLPADRELLLRTSVVDVLRPGLTEALGGRAAARRLSQLAHANVLVEEVAGQPGWFRYHPFLKDLLRAEVAFSSPRLTRRLERRAAQWYADQGMLTEAVVHAAVAGWWADAAAYAVGGLAVAELVVGDDSHEMVRALRGLPHDTSGADAAVVRAALALSQRDLATCDAELLHVQRTGELHGHVQGRDSTVLDLAVTAVITTRDCTIDSPDALASTRRHLDRLAAQPYPEPAGITAVTALAHASLGIAQLRSGDVAASGESFLSAAAAAEEVDSAPLLAAALAHLALVAALDGRLSRARHLACRSVSIADAAGIAPWARTPMADIALAWVSVERCDVQAGQRHLDVALRWHRGNWVARGLAAVVRSRMLRSLGDTTLAEVVAEEQRAELDPSASWVGDLLDLETAESMILHGRPARALALLAPPRTTDMRALVVTGHAQLQGHDWHALGGTLDRLAHPDTFGHIEERVGVLVLQCAHALHLGEGHRARTALRHALDLAAPETMCRPFREAPAAVREALVSDGSLLQQHAWLGMEPTRHSAERAGWWPSQATSPESVVGQVIEPLTPKEQEVLGLLAELLTTEEIAATMFVSVNTVRTHIRNLLRKLAVSRRNEAVRRARALRLIAG